MAWWAQCAWETFVSDLADVALRMMWWHQDKVVEGFVLTCGSPLWETPQDAGQS